MALKKKRLGELLVEKKIITDDDLAQALSYISKNGGRIGDALVALEVLSEDQLLGALRYHFGIPAVELKRIRIQQEIIDLVPKDTAMKHRAVPFNIKDKTLLVVMSNPMDLNAVEDIEFASGYRIQPILSKESDLAEALNAYYMGIEPKKAEEQTEEKGAVDDVLDEVDVVPGKPVEDEHDTAADVPDENLIFEDNPDYSPPPTPTREEAMASEEAHMEADTASDDAEADTASDDAEVDTQSEDIEAETPPDDAEADTSLDDQQANEFFLLNEVVLHPEIEYDEPVLSLEEVEIDYETAIEERRHLGDMVEELEDIDYIMHTAVMKNRRILKNLIVLLVKKGYITIEEVQELALSDVTEESTH